MLAKTSAVAIRGPQEALEGPLRPLGIHGPS